MSKEIFSYIPLSREEFSRPKPSLGINFGCTVVIANIIEGASVKDFKTELGVQAKVLYWITRQFFGAIMGNCD